MTSIQAIPKNKKEVRFTVRVRSPVCNVDLKIGPKTLVFPPA